MNVTISIADLAADKLKMNFGFDMTLRKLGKDAGQGNITIDAAVLSVIMRQYTPRPGQKPTTAADISAFLTPWNATPFTPANADKIIAARHLACYGDATHPKCDWNVDDLCQHPACKTCPGKQKASGALRAMIKQKWSTCGANKWQFKL